MKIVIKKIGEKPHWKKKYKIKTLELEKKLKIVFFHTCIEQCKGEILIWKGPNEHQEHTIRRCQQAIKAHHK